MRRKRRFDIDPQVNDKQMLIAKNRYLKLGKDKKPQENIRDMFIRIAKFIASVEKKYKTSKREISKLEEAFFQIQAQFKFLSGFTLSDRGRKKLMAACYVLPLEDNLESIYRTLYQSVQLHRLGAGVGYDFSPIRPEGSLVHSTGKEASGPISFMRLYDFSSEIILNRGSARHAGHMGILRIDHPDIEKFIFAKSDNTELTNFNLSVAITDKFMQAYKQGKDFALKNPQDGKVARRVKARTLMRLLAKSAHTSGEPGIIFIDQINSRNTIPSEEICATNLCGEQPLLPYEACNLGSVVLCKFIKDPKAPTGDKRIDWTALADTVRTAVHFLDNTIDLAYYVLSEIEEIVVLKNRKIGLGVMGWADLLAQLEIPYDSKEAEKLALKVMKFIQKKSREASCELARRKGSFGNFKKSIFPRLGYKYMRNATITTIAPTGTISLFAECNGGIEPFFALAYVRKNMETLGGKEFYYMNSILEDKLKLEWLYSKKLMKLIAKKGSIQGIEGIPTSIKQIFKTAYDIDAESHLRIQAAFQKYTDNAVSKTINLPKESTVEDIERIFVQAYGLKLKGGTIYRDKSRDTQVLNLNS